MLAAKHMPQCFLFRARIPPTITNKATIKDKVKITGVTQDGSSPSGGINIAREIP
jgi:hypothetical protein